MTERLTVGDLVHRRGGDCLVFELPVRVWGDVRAALGERGSTGGKSLTVAVSLDIVAVIRN